MKISNIILVLMGVTLLTSCESQVPPNVVNYWPKAGITYEIFVQSFFDTNGDGIGDLNGVTQKLDYVSDLGANAIWLMPIMPSPSYHKYDVTDYKAIHPDYGTLGDFKNLLEEAHKRDLKVVIDLIINHTSSEHPWFLESKKAGITRIGIIMFGLKKIRSRTLLKRKRSRWIRTISGSGMIQEMGRIFIMVFLWWNAGFEFRQ
ncbi:alpha-amylase family glycosyl hydrolase [Algoriphagus halophilus]